MVLHNNRKITSNQMIRKPTKSPTTNSEVNIINYLNKRTNLNKTETDLLNRKRLIQTLDLFNSKYDCKICCRKLRYKADEIIHAKLKHNPDSRAGTLTKRIQCPLCELTFTSYFKLKFHLMKLHLDERPYKCKECSCRFHSFLLLKKHCYSKHITVSGSSLASSFSSSFNSSVSSSSEKSFIDFIDYDNSSIDCASSHKSTLLPNSTTNPLSYNSDLNFKYFHQLDKINKSKNVDSLLDYLNDSKQANLNENTFTVITQLNVIDCNLCSKITYSNSEYLNHVWQEHLLVNKHFSSQFICWACVLANKTSPINTIDKYKFHTLVDLNTHCKQFKHMQQKAYKCSLCADAYFDDLSVCKAHYLSEHASSSDTESSKSYLDDMLDLAANLDSDAPVKLKSRHGEKKDKSYMFVFACFKCEQIYASYDCILNHFLTNCNMGGLSRTKCSQCSLTFSNIKQIEIHLKQHDYLAFNELLNKKNIKNSKNNKSYSIDALVSSINATSSTTSSQRRIDDIASRIMKKSQETANLFNTSLATSFLFNFQQHLNEHNSAKRLFDFNSLISNQDENRYTDLLSKMIKTNEPFYLNNNPIRKPSAFYSSSSSASNSGLFNSNPFLFTMPSMFKLDTSSKCDTDTVNPTAACTSNINNKKIKCDYCGYFFASLTELTQHKLMHQALNPKRPFKCHLCQVTFAKTDQLMRHMIVHQASELDSVCQVCYSSFSRKQDLDRHMLFHSK